jgi:hypothetical protein
MRWVIIPTAVAVSFGNPRTERQGMKTGWSRKFDDPIPLPKGRQLITLKDAGNYITKLPKAEHMAPEWQAAMEALILVATSGGPTMLARIGIMRALNRHVERVFNPSRKDPRIGGVASWRATANGSFRGSCDSRAGLRITPAFLESRRRSQPGGGFVLVDQRSRRTCRKLSQ